MKYGLPEGCDFASEEYKNYLGSEDVRNINEFWKNTRHWSDEVIEKNNKADYVVFCMLRNFVNKYDEINRGNICVYKFFRGKRTDSFVHSTEWKKLEKMVQEYENRKYEARKMKLEGEKDALAILKKAFDDAMTKGYKNVERAIASGNGLVDEKFKKCIKLAIDGGYKLYDAKWGKKRMCYYFTKSENGATNMNEDAIEEIYNHVSRLRGWAIYGL